MKSKTITIFLVTALLMCSLSAASANNNTTDTLEQIDLSQYITPVSISQNGVEFNDGFNGFSLSGNEDLKTTDPFTATQTSKIPNELGNYLKLAVIECYKHGCEDDIGKIISSFVDGSYKNSNNEIIKAVLDSSESISDYEVVQINNNTEATFDFELLKSESKASDYFAYKVSLKENKLAAGGDDAADANDTGNVRKEADTKNITNNTEKEVSGENNTNKTKNTTEVVVTNKTIINKTNTTIINENNTTIINNNNVKNITKDIPKNESDDNILMRTVGNPIFLLVVVVVILAVTAVVLKRRD